MTSDDTNLMEGDILKEEALTDAPQKNLNPNSQKKQLPKIDPLVLKAKIASFKRPKLITILALFFALIIAFILLIVLASKKPYDDTVDPDILITSPVPQNTAKKEQTDLEKNLKAYEDKANGLSDSIKNYPAPKVDLDVNF